MDSYITRELILQTLFTDITASTIESMAGKRCNQLCGMKPMFQCLRFTQFDKTATNTEPGPTGFYKKRSNSCRFSIGVKKFRLPASLPVTAKERFPFAPAATGDNFRLCFHNKIGFVVNKCGIKAECTAKGCISLRFSVIIAAQAVDGFNDYGLNGFNIRRCGFAVIKLR